MSAAVVTLAEPNSGASARVLVSRGFNCFSWKAPTAAGIKEVLYAPPDFEQGECRPSSGGTPLLFPFPGRIKGGRFSFEGESYEPPHGDGRGNALHGFAFDRAWRVVQQSAAEVTAEFRGAIDAPETLAYWPSDYALRATYRLEATRLSLALQYSNPGDKPLPCGFGTHAYFRLPLADSGSVEETVLTAPVDAQWHLEEMNPTGELLQNDAVRTLPGGLRLDAQQFDSVFRVATAGGDQVVTSLHNQAVRITQTCDSCFGCCVIYTPDHRQAICVEPYTCVPDPFGLDERGIDSGLTLLAPGESRSHTCVLEVGSA